ncbi:MAG: carbon-nitrogen hydrolase family protein [Armatimonadetes bacterium]|nr:carbon-nitrogen hydrolase family protein [Armatimonadota bacterium]
MSRTATLAVGQFQCAIGNKDANLSTMERLANEAARQGARLVCFPEMALTGCAGDLPETIPGRAVEQLGSIAKANHLYLIAGMPEVDPTTGKQYNACVLLDPQGNLAARYRKRCLYLGEKEVFESGDQDVLHDTDFCRLGLTICYDYVFAEYIRQLVDAGAELICHPTAWLTTDVCEAWHYSPVAYRAMGITRALENTVYFLSANLWGNYDAAGTMRAVGQSAIIAPWGEVLAEVTEGEGVAVATVDFDAAEGWRRAAAPYPEDRKRFGF